MSTAFPLKAPDIAPTPPGYHPATPPNEKTGVSYASVVEKPAFRSTHSWSTHSSASVESDIRDGKRSVEEPRSYAEAVQKSVKTEEKKEGGEGEGNGQEDGKRNRKDNGGEGEGEGEVRRRRRERDMDSEEQERGEWESYEVEKARRRMERKARRETREREENRREMMRTEKAGEDSVSDGTSNESREPEKRKKRELVTAVRS